MGGVRSKNTQDTMIRSFTSFSLGRIQFLHHSKFKKIFHFPYKKGCFYFVLFLEENAILLAKFLSYVSLPN